MNQKKIGAFIQSVRKSKGYTQKALGELLGVSDKTVSKWESGNSMPDISLILKLCSLLDINVNELLSGERLQTDSYAQKAEDNFLSLLSENKTRKRKEIYMIIPGIFLFVFALFFITLTDYGASGFLNGSLNVYLDLPALLTVSLLLCAVVFICGIRTAGVIRMIQKFALPCGALVSLFRIIGSLFRPDEAELMSLKCAISLLPVFYALIIYVIISVIGYFRNAS